MHGGAVTVLLSICASPVYTAAAFVKCWEKVSPGSQLLLNFNFNRSWEYRRMWTPRSVIEKQVVNLLLKRHWLPTQFLFIKSSAGPERSCHSDHFTVVFKHGNKDWDLYLGTLEIVCDGANQQTRVCGSNGCPWAVLGVGTTAWWCYRMDMFGFGGRDGKSVHVLDVFPQKGRCHWQWYLHLSSCHFSRSPT